MVLQQDLKTEAGGDGVIRTADNAILKLRKLGAYNRQQLSKPGIKQSLGITSLDDLMNQAGLNSFPYYSKVFKSSNFVKTKTKGYAHIHEVEILNSGHYTADTTIEVKEENTETMQNIIKKDHAVKTAAQIAESNAVIKKFEEDC